MRHPASHDLGWTRHGVVKAATPQDLKRIADELREEDKRELEDITGRPALQTILLASLVGEPCVTLWTHDGTPLAVLTIVKAGPNRAAISLSGTKDIEDFSTAFLRGSRECLVRLIQNHDILFNVCDARNTVHRKWLRWLGFTELREVEGYGSRGVTVVEFAKLRKD